MALSLELFSQSEPNAESITRIYRLPVFGCGSIMSGAGLRELERGVVKPRAAGGFEDLRLGSQFSHAIDAGLDRGGALFFPVNGNGRIEVIVARKPDSRPSLQAVDEVGNGNGDNASCRGGSMIRVTSGPGIIFVNVAAPVKRA
jgi:hypothetical protein